MYEVAWKYRSMMSLWANTLLHFILMSWFMTHLYLLVPSCSMYILQVQSLLITYPFFDWKILRKCLPFLMLLLGSPPLLFATCGRAPKEAVRLLLDRGANPNITFRKGYTVLHVIATMTNRGSLYVPAYPSFQNFVFVALFRFNLPYLISIIFKTKRIAVSGLQ